MGGDGVNALEEAGLRRSGLSRVVCDVANPEANGRIEAANIDNGYRLLDESVEVGRLESTGG